MIVIAYDVSIRSISYDFLIGPCYMLLMKSIMFYVSEMLNAYSHSTGVAHISNFGSFDMYG